MGYRTLNQHLNEQEDNEMAYQEAWMNAKEDPNFLQELIKEFWEDDIFVDIYTEMNRSDPDEWLIGQMFRFWMIKQREEYAQRKVEES